MTGSITLLVETLVASGCTPAVILAAVRTAEATKDAALEKSRENTRNRVKKWRAANPVTLQTVTKRSVTAHASASPAPDLENKQTNKEDKKTRTPRDELAVVLDADRVDAVIEHRIKLRKPLTAYAARQLAASFASCPDANAAADLMIESGWLKIKPDWIESRSRQNGHSPPARSMNDALEDIKSGRLDVFGLLNGNPDEPTHPTIDASFERTDRGSAGNPLQIDAVPSGR